MAAPPNPAHKVAYLGPTASYSHQSSLLAFPNPAHSLHPVPSIRDVFDAVQAGTASRGVVPFENSTHGTVSFTLDALADRTAALRDVVVCGEVYLPVKHCLLGRKPPGSAEVKEADVNEMHEGTDPAFAHIRRVYSHPQGFGQCGAFLRARLRHAELVDVSSTSRAAEMAVEDESGESAAIASELAGTMLGERGLEIWVRGVQDRDDNVTRFFVLRKGEGEDGEEVREGARWKSLLSFTVPHDRPGALADVLGCFRLGGLNLTSINSLPSLERPFQYLFFVEFEGRRGGGGEDAGVVEGVLGEVGKVAQSWRWLGSWENQRPE